ncbi:MAG: hypothetical protein IJH39_05055 [Clostridia bacterium]|nr:hypothetical protein [Clostridia bacterium]
MTPEEIFEQDRDLRIYAFEHALNIIEHSIEVFNKESINDIFDLSNRIYKYLKNDNND